MTERAPARLGKYEIVRQLGEGAMGVVYLAYDPTIDRQVAVKTIRKDLLDVPAASQAAARLRQEAMAAGRLVHPGIVAVYDFGEDENVGYIVMEYAPGEDLGRYAAGRRLGLPEIGTLLVQLLDALEYAHGAGVVHRDIKPSNILLSGRLKVTDFGIARIAHSTLTQTGAVVGTPAYMAPEQYSGAGVDHRGDLFASGALFYELLTGVQAFGGESIPEIAYRVCHAEHVPATRLRPELPAGVDAVLSRALAKRKEERYPSAREFSRAIETALAGGEATPGPAAVTPTPVAPEAIERVTRTLAKHLGPIAKVIVKKAAAEAQTYWDLCVTVSSRLPAEERPRFLKEVGVE